MKKFLAIAFIAATTLVACNEETKKDAENTVDQAAQDVNNAATEIKEDAQNVADQAAVDSSAAVIDSVATKVGN